MDVGEECGMAFGHNMSEVLEIDREMINRGKEFTGIGVKVPGGIDVVKWSGDGSRFSEKRLYGLLYGGVVRDGPCIGHVRYSTSGEKNLRGAHPHYAEPAKVTDHGTHIIARRARTAIVHNGNVPDIDDILSSLGMGKYKGLDTDTEKILAIYMRLGEKGVMENVLGSFSIAILDRDREESIIMRDRFGIRPLWIGESSGRRIAASEDSLITAINGFPIREVEPGECVYMYPDGSIEEARFVEPCPKQCMFEFQYFSRWESHMGGRWIRDVRYQEGMELAAEFMPEDLDVVTYVPETSRPAADAYSRAAKERLGLERTPFQELLYKMRPKDRSFMEGEQDDRENSIGENLYIKDNIYIVEKNVLVIDDSIVRGTNIPRAVKHLRDRGASKVYVAILTPPIGGRHGGESVGCLYGVDMPPGDDFAIAKHGDEEGIARAIKADKLHYLSKDGMIRGIGIPEENLCTYCIGGEDPIRAYKERMLK
jgi:amidophosphoribosyltransferase